MLLRPRSASVARGRPIAWLLVLAVVTLLVVDSLTEGSLGSGARAAARDAVAVVETTLTQAWSRPPLNDLRAENDRLRAEVEANSGTLAVAAEVQRERDRLAELAAVPFVAAVPRVVARVTVAGAGNFDATVELDKGTRSGVEVGMPVVTGAGLVGRTVEASRDRATVLFLGDRSSNVGVRLGKSGEVGVAVGTGMQGALDVEFVDIGADVQIGEFAVTSGQQQSLFPPGLPVGRVITADPASPGSGRKVAVAPLVDPTRLDLVSVLQWRPSP